MRFEEVFKQQIVEWLSTELQTTTTEGGVTVVYDPSILNNTETLTNPLYEDKNTYGVCVRNNTIVRSNLADIDFNTITFTVESVMEENSTQKFLDATEHIATLYDSSLQSYVETVDATTTPATTITTQYKPAFGVAYVSRPRYTLHTNKGSIKANTVTWVITVQYSVSSIFLTKQTFSITVGGNAYSLSNILEYSLTGQLTSRDVQQVDQSRLTSHAVNYLNTYSFTIRKTTESSGINSILESGCIDASTFALSSITIGSTAYNVKKFQLTEIWRDNVGAYQLTILDVEELALWDKLFALISASGV